MPHKTKTWIELEIERIKASNPPYFYREPR